MKYSYDVEKLKLAVSKSYNLASLARELGIVPAGGNYNTLKAKIKKHCINTGHWDKEHLFTRTNQPKNKPVQKKISIEDLFVENSPWAASNRIKRRAIQEKLLDYHCALCHIDSWAGKPLVLHLDHINGVNNDNRIENLRLLCPNCHSQTDTYCGKNKGKYTAGI